MSVAYELPPSASPAVAHVRSRLASAVERFVELERSAADLAPAKLYHEVLASVHDICAAIVDAEEASLSREEIVEIIAPVREIHADSPFVDRLQRWPRGYPGDFETVEYICGARNNAPSNTVAYVCEQYALTRGIAQQHRNKVALQADRITRTMMRRPGATRVLSIACGSCPDYRAIPHLADIAGEIWLNDLDEEALAFAQQELTHVASKLHVVSGDAYDAASRLAAQGQQFDLVIAGGLFDYLRKGTAVRLVRVIVRRLLANGGTFFFTNIAAGNPYRPLIEYFGDWRLIERTEEEIEKLAELNGIDRSRVTITRDSTGLALIVEIR